ncbi:RtcB family protein [Thermoanaerobacter thermohydrosulfuricus]
MLKVKGKYNEAIIYTDNVEEEALKQILELCDEESFKDSKIRIMPDTHAGIGCTIGTTMTIKDKVVPNLVGVDIGCGMEVAVLKEKNLNLEKLDRIIHNFIPAGQNVREKEHEYIKKVNLEELQCKDYIDLTRARLSIGTLGGGNHFIEVDKDSDDNIYIVIHSGSRYLGKQVAEYYQEIAYKELTSLREEKEKIIEKLKAEGRQKEIQSELAKLKVPKIKKDLAYLKGNSFNNYIHDMGIVQLYATYNRKAIIDEIINKMNLTVIDQFTTIHNYIDLENMILRKGAISAQEGERVIIPINMRDGSIIAVGKGNPEWNYSAPHGAGRIMSRSKAKELINMNDFIKSMEGVYSTTINKYTIDEAPMVYKPIEEIINNIHETVSISKIIKPIYNFKASE